MSYDEAIWDGDEGDASIGSQLEPSTFQTRDDAERRLGIARGEDLKFDRIEVPFSTKYRIGDLKNVTSLVFSVANNALNADEFTYSNKADHEGELGSQPYDIVNKVSFKNLSITNMKSVSNLYAEFPNIRAAKHHSFGKIPSSTVGNESGKAGSPVRFVVTPNTSESGAFNANYQSNVIGHATAFSSLNKETLRKTYGRIGNNGLNWLDYNSPIYSALLDEHDDLLVEDHKNGVYTYKGDYADLEEAEKNLLEINENYLAFSDLTPSKFAFRLTVPPESVYKKELEKHETQQQTFYELAAGPRAASMLNSKQQPNSEAAKAVRDFDNSFTSISGIAVIESKKIASKYAV